MVNETHESRMETLISKSMVNKCAVKNERVTQEMLKVKQNGTTGDLFSLLLVIESPTDVYCWYSPY